MNTARDQLAYVRQHIELLRFASTGGPEALRLAAEEVLRAVDRLGPPAPELDALGAARRHLQWVVSTGAAQVICPVCNQKVGAQKRRVYAVQGRWLIWLYRRHRDQPGIWSHATQDYPHGGKLAQNSGGDYAKLAWPGLQLIEKFVGGKDAKKGAGLWRIAEDRGCAFVEGRLRIPKFFHTYNERTIEVSEETVDIRDVLHSHFSYDELLMAGYDDPVWSQDA